VSLLVTVLVAFGGVLFGYLVGYLVGSSKGRALERARLDEAEGVRCYECRSRVAPEWIFEDDDGGFPVCPVCGGNMLPPVGSRAADSLLSGGVTDKGRDLGREGRE